MQSFALPFNLGWSSADAFHLFYDNLVWDPIFQPRFNSSKKKFLRVYLSARQTSPEFIEELSAKHNVPEYADPEITFSKLNYLKIEIWFLKSVSLLSKLHMNNLLFLVGLSAPSPTTAGAVSLISLARRFGMLSLGGVWERGEFRRWSNMERS